MTDGFVKTSSRAAGSPSAKDSRLREILTNVHRDGPTTRAALARRLGWSAPSVTRLATELVDRGLLLEARSPAGGERGRPARRLTIAPGSALGLGIEMAPDAVRWALVDSSGAHLDEGGYAEDRLEPSPAFLDVTLDAVRGQALARGWRWSDVRAFTVAPHGYVTSSGVWRHEEGSELISVPVRDHLEAATGRTVFVEDIARAFAVSERRAVADAPTDAIYVLFGLNSLGSGIFSDGRLLRTSLGICGEIGHVSVVPNGLPCSCGGHGCLCRYASASALLARDPRRAASLAMLCERARSGERIAQEVLTGAIPLLARGLANVVAITGTPRIVLGGALTDAGPLFADELTAALGKRVIRSLTPHLAVRYATGGLYSPAKGAALLALDTYWAAPDLRRR